MNLFYSKPPLDAQHHSSQVGENSPSNSSLLIWRYQSRNSMKNTKLNQPIDLPKITGRWWISSTIHTHRLLYMNVKRSSIYASFEIRKPSSPCSCTWTHKICRDDERATLRNSSHNRRCTYNTANNMQTSQRIFHWNIVSPQINLSRQQPLKLAGMHMILSTTFLGSTGTSLETQPS